MYLTTEVKKEIFKKYGSSETNTGSTEGQIALFTHRINHLSNHLKKKDINKYRELIKELNIRK